MLLWTQMTAYNLRWIQVFIFNRIGFNRIYIVDCENAPEPIQTKTSFL